MFLHSIGQILLAQTNQASGATALAGPALRITPQPGDEVISSQQQFSFWASTQFNGGSGSGPAPSGQIKIQGSADGVTWLDIAAGVAQPSDDAIRMEKLTPTANMAIPKFIRVVSVLVVGGSGGAAPTKQVASVWVSSNADFTVGS